MFIFKKGGEKLRIAIRADSSTVIGSGHLMRCLTLAKRLRKENDAEVHFISRDLEGNLSEIIKREGFFLHVLPRHDKDDGLTGYAAWLTVPQTVDAAETKAALKDIGRVSRLVVDSYALDIAWEREMRPFTDEIFVIDDLANRKHDSDILLDQNFYLDMERRYVGLVPERCKLLIGPRHALLREEFYEARKHLRKRDGKIRRILVFYGGSDLTNETMKALKALAELSLPDVTADVVVGAGNPHKAEIEAFCAKHEFLRYHCQINNMAELMNQADLALGAGGSTTWERMYLKLPSIVTTIAENQVQTIKDCSRAGSVYYLGTAEEATPLAIQKALLDRIKDMGASNAGRGGES